MTWELYACEGWEKGIHGTLNRSKRMVELCNPGVPITTVLFTEHREGKYWAWVRAGEDTPTFVECCRIALNILFPYGAESAEKNGLGRVVRGNVSTIN